MDWIELVQGDMTGPGKHGIESSGSVKGREAS